MKKIKLLICDDDRDNLDILEVLLEFEGFEVIKEIDSTKLIQKITAHTPDLLLVDIIMPIVSGEDIIRTIRNNANIKELPIIAFSAGYNIKETALDAGANYFAYKPFDVGEIKKMIVELVV
ncbi:hypothetical protein BA768_20660 [Chryseobacterium sp. CBo1]|uniref:response regulator n=1 Tax=Chryseobacterium sp. CBo1 TaxID=1869230 RepID=UPI0008106DD0|nr:response regulator [Chryseobacterium sp. CBo1]OCK50069.1 hypothetical protein BA768_20660 [Chryseobacterium sp. CBo1]